MCEVYALSGFAHGSAQVGHFYFAQNQTFLLGCNTQKVRNALHTVTGLVAVLGQWRDIWAYIANGDSAAGARLENRLAPLGGDTYYPMAKHGLFEDGREQQYDLPAVDIVVPVFDALEDTRHCLDNLAVHTDPRHRVIVIDDASPDPRIAPMLRDWVDAHGNATLVVQETNAGFIACVNRGIALAQGHVVLLNTDAFVPPGWIDRLMAPMLLDTKVASITPMSNNAEIYTAPVACIRFEPAKGQALDMDRVAARFEPTAATADAPTGVGFCMAMNGAFLEKVGTFDTVFGRGYGEEVDWCRKTAALGGRHLGIGNLYVEHRGGGSFGAEKRALIRKNNRVINQRYAGYDEAVARFRHHDPLVGPRLALAMSAIDAGGAVPVFVSQRLGGGSEFWLDQQILAYTRRGKGAVVVRQSLADPAKMVLEVHTPLGATVGRIALDEMADYLGVLRRRMLIYACLVNTEAPLDLLRKLLKLLRQEDGCRVVLHDFFPLCPSYNLISNEGQFCGLPDADTCQTCYALLPQTSGQRPDTIVEWREAWAQFLRRADEVTVFSHDSAAHLGKLWPDLAPKVAVRPHQPDHLPVPVARPRSEPFTLGVLGAVGRTKGAAVVRALAELVDKEFKVVVIGHIDPAFAHGSLLVNGAYEREEIGELAEKYRIGAWLIPSIWPETFCFTAHECMATELPVFVFDLGAQAEAVRGYSHGHVMERDIDAAGIKVLVTEAMRKNMHKAQDLAK